MAKPMNEYELWMQAIAEAEDANNWLQGTYAALDELHQAQQDAEEAEAELEERKGQAELTYSDWDDLGVPKY